MTDDEKELKLQAFFDGELPEAEAREVASWLAQDREAADLHKELRNTRQALSGFEREINVPESREFYWSKIAREIERTERLEPVRTPASALVWLRRLLLPLAGLAMVVGVVIRALQPTPVEAQPEFESSTDDCGAVTFRNEDEGMTVVWYSFDGENQPQEQNASGANGNK